MRVMINTIVVGFDDEIIQNVIKMLNNNNVICLKKWMVADDSRINLPNAEYWRHIIQGRNINHKFNYVIPKSYYDVLLENMHKYMDNLVRESYFENRFYIENYNSINILLNYFYNLLVEENIRMIIFSDAPHGAYANIIYDIAKLLDIETLILFPCYMRDKVLYCWDLNDIGYYKMNRVKFDVEVSRTLIGSGYKKNVFWAPKEKKSVSTIIERKIDTFKNRKYKYDDLYDYISKHVIRKLSRWYYNYLYKKNSSNLFIDNVSEDAFVYFPMHLQPEMTTATLGNEYRDQILAIERILEIIPNNWYIYVKENPLQDYRWRDKYFFARLKSLPRIKFVTNNTNTYELIDKCKFVATITGTAGFEAISGGKPVLVFGLAWYRCLSGVTVYSDDVRLNDILKPFSIENVKLDFDKYIKPYFIECVVADDVYKYAEGFNEKKNKMILFYALKQLIESRNINNEK